MVFIVKVGEGQHLNIYNVYRVSFNKILLNVIQHKNSHGDKKLFLSMENISNKNIYAKKILTKLG